MGTKVGKISAKVGMHDNACFVCPRRIHVPILARKALVSTLLNTRAVRHFMLGTRSTILPSRSRLTDRRHRESRLLPRTRRRSL